MSYRGGRVEWGKAIRDGRVNDIVDFARLIQMCRFDCATTLYRSCGKVNCRRFGVTRGGYTVPALAILCCAIVANGMEHLGELVGFVVRYMGDVFSIYALSNDADEKLVSEYLDEWR